MNNTISATNSLVDQLTHSAIDMHCHGIGGFDFTEISTVDLNAIETILAQRQQQTILTLYLYQYQFENFISLCEKFSHGKKIGKYSHIMGLSLEGPLLSSIGGTPSSTVWVPTEEQWRELAKCGKQGLLYVIFSPDISLANNKQLHTISKKSPDIITITEILLDGGVLPSPGHFLKSDPITSAYLLQTIFDVVAANGTGPIITDHLFNDMPHNFKHAWRTPTERAQRDAELKSIKIESWNMQNLEETMGPVPAVMIRNAKKGLAKICHNFDGEHVDLEITKRCVELIGPENLLMMTDSIESEQLANRNLFKPTYSSLLYQADGIVAAGSSTVTQQIQNMFAMGLSTANIRMITCTNPRSILEQCYHVVSNEIYHPESIAL